MSSTALAPAATAAEILSEIRIAPSILAADHARLGEQVGEVLDAGARVIHFDVMDGHFVPPITFGPVVVSALSERVHAAGGVVDVHLMIERPERQIAQFADAGADVITIHSEATPNVHYALGAVRDAGCVAGLALNPGTPPEVVAPLSNLIDLCLCMTVNPGWGGQRLIDSTRAKISHLRELLPERCAVEVDGGIDPDTALGCVQRGASLLVAGSAIFGRPDPTDAYRELVAATGAI
jgi:ribulose-phosphate 3-epimerase